VEKGDEGGARAALVVGAPYLCDPSWESL